MKVWGCVAHYGVAVFLALLVGGILGNIPLFKEAALGSSKLTMAHVIQFLAYGGALVMLWMMGHRLTTRMPKNGKWSSALRPVMTPLVTFVVVMAAYSVIPLVGGPYMTKKGQEIYNWVFIVGMVVAAFWLTIAWVVQSGAALEGRRRAS